MSEGSAATVSEYFCFCETPDDKKGKFVNQSILRETVYNSGDEYRVLSPSILVW
jgi:hypothetical protein